MVKLFKQVNKGIYILPLCILVMATSFNACDNADDVNDNNAGLSPAKPVKLMSRPPDYHDSINKQASSAVERKEPIIIDGRDNSKKMSLTNRTGRNISTQELTVEVKASDSSEDIPSPLKQLTLGKATGVNNGTKRPLSSICGLVTIQPTKDISFSVQDIEVDPKLLGSSSLHFHLIVTGNGIQTIDQEVIWNP